MLAGGIETTGEREGWAKSHREDEVPGGKRGRGVGRKE